MEPVPSNTFVIKIAEHCNLDCDYCYMYNGADLSFKSRPRVLGPNTEQALLSALQEHLKDTRLDRLNIFLHGGEPLLFGKKRFSKLAKTLRKQLYCDLHLSVQTNGLLIDSEWIDIFLQNKISVCLSCDGPQHIHDAHRHFTNGAGSYEQTLEAIQCVTKEATYQGLKYSGIISVANASISGDEYYSWIKEVIHPPRFDVLLPDADWESPYQNPNILIDYYLSMFESWWSDRPDEIRMTFFESIISTILDTPSHAENFGGFSASTIIIETDGSIHPHDVFRIRVPLSADPTDNIFVGENKISDINNNHLYKIAAERFELDDAFIQRRLGVKCMDCKIINKCRGGFVAHRYSRQNEYRNESVYCDLLYSLYHTIKHALDLHRSNDHLPIEATQY